MLNLADPRSGGVGLRTLDRCVLLDLTFSRSSVVLDVTCPFRVCRFSTPTRGQRGEARASCDHSCGWWGAAGWAVLQVSSYGRSQLIVGRVVTGIGIGLLTAALPIGMDRQQSLLGAGGLQFFSLCASFIPWYAIDRGGRRRLIMSTLAGMGVCLAVSGALVRYGGKANGIGATDMLYLFGVYLAEPLPLRLRGTGNALAVCSQWLQRSSLSRSRLQPSLTSATGRT
ncbi:hypothetical protein G7K_3825-t1 [Saitoella complicata NRRL Y-17804]|uniref:Major facilitator superfamily (MFS) profile domain-containing protein n=1 Tax=Saitoella complicata (strain BCRC 22490 / CBS 7301 / JCM 7358 / NBRC 10748 / NRRL Y-17804) TaxID=698492 RepID=A0A0E9NIK7_SAICN|nr:hypothetical protein G7K_3825-t1 [Saitoella complicata NRRL Y-17804]